MSSCNPSQGVGGVGISLYNDGWASTWSYATTDTGGYYTIPQKIRINDWYQVSVSSLPSGYSGRYTPYPPENGQTKNWCLGIDTPGGSARYDCQKTGVDDCSGPNSTGSWFRCNFILQCAATCNVGTFNAPSQIVKGSSQTISVNVVPSNGGKIQTINAELLAGSTGVTLGPVTFTPTIPTVNSETVTVNIQINTTPTSSGSVTVRVTGTIEGGVACVANQSNAISLVDPAQNWYTSQGGDVIVAGGVVGAMVPTSPSGLKFIMDDTGGSGAPGMAFGQDYYPGLTTTNVNSKSWLINISSVNWNVVKNKRENQYATIKDRILNKVKTPLVICTDAAARGCIGADKLSGWGNTATNISVTSDNMVQGTDLVVFTASGNVTFPDMYTGSNKVIVLVDGIVDFQGQVKNNAALFAVFAGGDLRFSGNVGDEAPTDVSLTGGIPNFVGLFFTQGNFDSYWTSGGTVSTKAIRIAGQVIAMGNVDLSHRKQAYGTTPSHHFRYRPHTAMSLMEAVGLRRKIVRELGIP